MTTLFTVEQNGEELWWSLQELSNSSALQPEFIVQCVELGLVDASGVQTQWRFNSDGRFRLQKAWRLHRDLEVQVSALPLVLQLLGSGLPAQALAALGTKSGLMQKHIYQPGCSETAWQRWKKNTNSILPIW
jgi:hypothetical protein